MCLCVLWLYIGCCTKSVADSTIFAIFEEHSPIWQSYFRAKVTMVKPRFQWVRMWKCLVLLANRCKLLSLKLIYTMTSSWKICFPLSPPQEIRGSAFFIYLHVNLLLYTFYLNIVTSFCKRWNLILAPFKEIMDLVRGFLCFNWFNCICNILWCVRGLKSNLFSKSNIYQKKAQLNPLTHTRSQLKIFSRLRQLWKLSFWSF